MTPSLTHKSWLHSIILASLAAFLLLPTISNAKDYASQCDFSLGQLDTAIKADVWNDVRNASWSQTKLLDKLEAAVVKIGKDKYSDAYDKMVDIQETADALANSRKPKLSDATDIDDAAEDVKICLNYNFINPPS